MNRQSAKDLGVGENILYDTEMVSMCHYTIVKMQSNVQHQEQTLL